MTARVIEKIDSVIFNLLDLRIERRVEQIEGIIANSRHFTAAHLSMKFKAWFFGKNDKLGLPPPGKRP
jgi:hypothetical protein